MGVRTKYRFRLPSKSLNSILLQTEIGMDKAKVAIPQVDFSRYTFGVSIVGFFYNRLDETFMTYFDATVAALGQ